ncbi:Zinc finger MYM-type protein 1 [Glycine soja]
MFKLANEGSKDWRNLSVKLKSHEITNEHITNMNAWIDLEMRLVKNKTIDKHVQEQINRDREHWRNVLLRIITVVKTLGKNNLVFHEKNEKIYQEANGNFLSLIEIIAEFDPIMQNISVELKMMKFTTITLGIIYKMSEIKIKIIKKIKDAKYYAIILDCTPDISHQEQMSFVLRCVDISSTPIQVNGYFLEFLKVDDTSGKGHFDAIIDELKIVGLDINDLRGQGYDNGSNMKGKHQGVQKRFLDINPRSFYTPCSCHSLNLVLYDMVNSCPKLHLSLVCYNVYTLYFLLLQKANYELENFEFLLGITVWYDILFAVNLVSKNLQSKDMCIDEAIEQLKDLLSFFENYRENIFENALIST